MISKYIFLSNVDYLKKKTIILNYLPFKGLGSDGGGLEDSVFNVGQNGRRLAGKMPCKKYTSISKTILVSHSKKINNYMYYHVLL